ncbi:hypothetical protein [uncultured Methanobrevibacter sp.]|uniref:hypothetical protein n=1 Tax=uncultured Methanobrevibacter sp. TaxID=253161 RepID=UPI0025DB3732|nr:hypothetical protein [uncultured Methanobrevibacter sp.]
MANYLKVFSGILLLAMGIAILILNYFYKFREFIIVLGMIIAIVGLLIILTSGSTKIISFGNDKRVFREKSKSPADKFKNMEIKGLNNMPNLDDIDSFNLGSLENAQKNISNKVNDIYKSVPSKKNPKAVLKVESNTSKFTDKTYQFTPNYERPLKITRKPAKKQGHNTGLFNISNIPKSDKSKVIEEELGKNNLEKLDSNLYLNKDDLSHGEFIHVDHSQDDFYSPEGDYIGYREPVSDDESVVVEDNTLEEEIVPVPVEDLFEDDEDGEIVIDPNNPESIPIPKLLRSYVIGSNGKISTQEAFDELSAKANREVCLITTSLKDLSHDFLLNISNIPTKIIIEDMDLSDLSEKLVISSIINKNVEIRTMPKLNTINLIIDNNYALIVSDDEEDENFQYGAVYDDNKSIDDIKNMFDSTWNLAEKIYTPEFASV